MSAFKNIYYCLKYDLTRNRWLKKGANSPAIGHVLMFHHVTDKEVDINPSCLCKVEVFKSILLKYQEEGYEFVSVETALSYVKEDKERRFVVVTFDDIPDNVFTNAYPFLKENNIPFTVFITVNFIGKSDYITDEHLQVLNREPICTIGAHTMNHPLLRQVKNSDWEIKQSKIELEHILKKQIKLFAYPYGRFSAVSNKVKRQVKHAGYELAFCTVCSPLTKFSANDLFFLPRIVPPADRFLQFRPEWTVIGAIRMLAAKVLHFSR